MRLLRSLPFLVALLGVTPTTVHAAGKVTVKKTSFTNLPQEYFYFEDSPCILSFDQAHGVIYRSDDSGATWNAVSEGKGKAYDLYQHPFDNSKAYILTVGETHYKTEDRGKTWQEWNSVDLPSNRQGPLPAMNFHSGKGKSDYIILLAQVCDDAFDFEIGDCQQRAYYTQDNFKTKPKLLLDNTHGCTFARSSKQFDAATDDTVLCVVEGSNSYLSDKRRIYVSDNYFKGATVDSGVEPKLDGQSTYQGVTGIAVVQKFLIVAVKSTGTTEMGLFISGNAKDWERAEFPSEHGKVEQDAYTILESMPSSLQVDVLTTKANNPVGSLFASNSKGTQFVRILENTNRNSRGLVDWEAISNVEGIILSNVVSNAKDLYDQRGGVKKLVSKISFDNGRTWKDLKSDGKPLHLHSVSDLTNLGRVYSSPAPGMVMGIGNTGDYLKDYIDGDLYVSEDAGLTWRMARKGAHKYEFGDQGSILVAIDDEDKTSKVVYSLDHGNNWEEVDLGITVRARLLTTTPDSTSTKFTMVAVGPPDDDSKRYYIFHLDFSEVRSRTCKEDKSGKGDFEKWYARLDDKGDPDCLLGHKQFFWRRKKDADCFVNDLYKEQEPEREVCKCTAEDYECDINFVRENGNPGDKCIPKNAKFDDKGKCGKSSDKFTGPSGYRLIPGDSCDKSGGEDLEKEIERPCDDIKTTPPSSGKVKHSSQSFDGDMYIEQFYIERSETSSGSDETLVIRTRTGVWISHDHGVKWEEPDDLKKKEIVAIYPNPYVHDHVYFLTPSEDVIYTHDRGKTFHTFKAPGAPNGLGIDAINFHPLRKGSMIWTSHKECPGTNCHAIAHYTIDGGDSWKTLIPWVRYCRWIANSYMDRKNLDPNMIFCERYAGEDTKNGLELVTSDTFFMKEEVIFRGIKGFATMEEFINVAVVDEEKATLKVAASLDGKVFADANFPRGFEVPHQHAYTVLESITHAVYLHVTVSDVSGKEYGAILKSNSNGTEYVMSLPNVNRDDLGYVDFERMQGLEGVALANIVINIKEVENGATKKYKSMITHNDGGAWTAITPPTKDSEDKNYLCSGGLDKCSLNLHGYTERFDKRHTYSSSSAVGLMLAVGNVGPELTPYNDGNTFLTRDGGLTWKEIHKGSYMWEYGDQGSIIAIVKEHEPTKSILYTINEGSDWQEYTFSDTAVNVFDISSVPSDTSRKFIVWAKENGAAKFSAFAIDFTGLTDKQCKLDTEHPDTDDFELWKPSHPQMEDGCLFGHQASYARKIPGNNCFIGRRIPQPHKMEDNCTCTRHDFECDYNYEIATDGSCQLVAGLSPPDHKLACADNPNLVDWFEPTGYRRIPLTTCRDGTQLDKSTAHPCPGKENQFKKEHAGIGAVGIFFLTILVLGMAGIIGFVLFQRWPGKLGAIRLGDEPREESPFVKYPVIALSAVVAVVVAIPAILAALYRIVASRFQRRPRYTTRGSFARGDYDHVENDEGELLGEDSDDEV
ncbi:vacuolar protein sorting/targeting protein PEP1 [Orbilia ellipsospora]|uniref:Vacuolar protein sorting/targeting protein 10 n=1 Tax=Orbilia ellipsospora TaxID=2528407 RepID=A0AAV9XIJ6_9PEZI